MSRVLYTSFGTTDPVRGMRDGGMMHILRYYRPDAVYLFLSAEIIGMDRKDERIAKTFEFIRENWDGYAPTVVRYETDIVDPSDMDILMDPMNALFEKVIAENPKAEVLLNLSSGTPQMQIIMAQMALDPRYNTRGIQVKNPERKSGTAERTNVNYPLDEALGLNEDEEPGFPNRCCEPKMTAVRREAVRNQLESLLRHRNYDAIAQMGADLPVPIPKLAKHLDYRSRFLVKLAEAEAAGLSGMGLHADKGVYPYQVYEMVEFFAVLKNMVQMRRYTDFVLRMNPFVIELQIIMLQVRLKPRGLKESDLIITRGKHKLLSPELIRRNAPALEQQLVKRFGGALTERDLSIPALNVMLDFYGEDPDAMKLLLACEAINQALRNSVAHTLFAVSNDQIFSICGVNADGIIRGLEKELVRVLEPYGDKNLKRRINIYDFCDRIIRERANL